MTERVAVVGLPGGWSSEQLADAFAQRTGQRLLVDLGKTVLDCAKGRVLFEGIDLCTLDALVVKKVDREYSPDMLDRLELLRFVESCGVRVFSKPTQILRLVDRLACTITLRAGGIPIPETVITEDLELAASAIVEFGGAVLKPLYSTKARGMVLVETRDRSHALAELQAFRAAGNKMLYVQRKLVLGERDLGIVFIGGRYVTTYARKAHGSSWNTTTREGGRYERYEPSAEVIELAHRAQALFDLDFTTVDLVETSEGPRIFEVSAFGGFRGLRDAADIDAASLFANYVLGSIRHEA